jgi:Beta-lactamase.
MWWRYRAATVVSLALEGKLDLQALVAKYLPFLRSAVGRVTAHQLLTHTAGLKRLRRHEWSAR